MLKSALPLPSTTPEHGVSSRFGLSKRALKLILSGALVLVTLCFYMFSFTSTPAQRRIDIAELERILEDHASSAIVGSGTDEDLPVYDGEGLTSLGLEADESFRLGATLMADYRLELEEFVQTAFPSNYKKDAMASLHRHLDESGTQTSFSPIPKKCVLSIFTIVTNVDADADLLFILISLLCAKNMADC